MYREVSENIHTVATWILFLRGKCSCVYIPFILLQFHVITESSWYCVRHRWSLADYFWWSVLPHWEEFSSSVKITSYCSMNYFEKQFIAFLEPVLRFCPVCVVSRSTQDWILVVCGREGLCCGHIALCMFLFFCWSFASTANGSDQLYSSLAWTCV